MLRTIITDDAITNEYYHSIGIYFKNKEILKEFGRNKVSELVGGQTDVIYYNDVSIGEVIRIGYDEEGIIWKDKEMTVEDCEAQNIDIDIFADDLDEFFITRIELNEIDEDNRHIFIGKCFYGSSDDRNFIQFEGSQNIIYHNCNQQLVIID